MLLPQDELKLFEKMAEKDHQKLSTWIRETLRRLIGANGGALNMVIEVRYQRAEDAKDPRAHFIETKYFEIDQMPDRKMVAQKLMRMGVDFDEGSILIEACKDDAETMRTGNILVLKILD